MKKIFSRHHNFISYFKHFVNIFVNIFFLYYYKSPSFSAFFFNLQLRVHLHCVPPPKTSFSLFFSKSLIKKIVLPQSKHLFLEKSGLNSRILTPFEVEMS